MTRFGHTYTPLTYRQWSLNPRAQYRGVSFGQAWELTKESLRGHLSHSYAALAKFAYVPAAAEIVLWVELVRKKQLRKRTYRPWMDKQNNLFKPTHNPHYLTAKDREARAKLKAIYHIND